MLLKFSVMFGIITFSVCTVFEFFAHYVFKLEKDLPSWTFIKWLPLNLLLVVFIAMANYIYFMHCLLYTSPSPRD